MYDVLNAEIRMALVQQLIQVRGAAATDIQSIIRDVTTLVEFINPTDDDDEDNAQLILIDG